MKNEELIKVIDDTIMTNRIAKQLATTEMEKDSFRKSNDVLARARTILKSQKEYERGANEAWELVRIIYASIANGGLSHTDINDIFGCYFENVTTKYTASDALSAYNDWLEEQKKKEEEAAKPKLGDVVEVHYVFNGVIERGILLSIGDTGFNYLDTGGKLINASYFSGVELKKTGEHVDIQGMLDKIG